MPIQKDLVLDATGGTASYHTVRMIGLDLSAQTTLATLMSYVSADAFKAGKQPASFQMVNVTVLGLPDAGQSALDFIESELVKEGATDGPIFASRNMFAGGTVVA